MNGRVLIAEKRIELGRIISSDHLEIDLSLKSVPEGREYDPPSQAPRRFNEATPGKRRPDWPHYDTGRAGQPNEAKAAVQVNSVVASIRTRPV